MQTGVINLERSGILQPAHTVLGRIEQALKWLENPNVDDKGLGRAGEIIVNFVLLSVKNKNGRFVLRQVSTPSNW